MDTPPFLGELAGRHHLFRARERFFRAVRSFFHSRGFLEVDAPLLVPAAGMEPHLDPFEAVGWATRARAFLPTSPEMYLKKLLASGVDRCFSLAPSFRDEIPSRSHSPEFLMLEWYRVREGLESLVQDCGSLLAEAGSLHLAEAGPGPNGVTCRLDAGVEVMPLSEATLRWAGTDWLELESLAAWRAAAAARGAGACEAWDENDCFSYLMVACVEPGLKELDRPVALVGYPAFQAALARLDPRDARVSLRFELYAAGVELANAYDELVDEDDLRRRFSAYQIARKAAGKPPHPADEAFLVSAGFMPPCAGIALGADRLLALFLGEPVSRIRHGC